MTNPDSTPARRSRRARWLVFQRRRWAVRLRNHLLAGLLVTMPTVATFWLVWKVISFVDHRMQPLIPERFNPATYLPVGIPGLGLLIAVVGLVVIGCIATTFAGRLLTRASDSLFSRVPLIRSIYSWSKQVFETVLAHKSSAFRQVVLVEYPRRGVWAVGFVTGRTEGEVQELTADTVVNVFLPATPNVTTGFLLFLPERDIRPLDISVEDGLKMVISGGIVTPSPAEPVPQLLAADAVAPLEPVPQDGVGARLRHWFFAGLVVAGPVGITLWLVWAAISFVDARVALLVPEEWRRVADLDLLIPGLGFLVVVIALIVLGMFATGVVGRTLIRTGEGVLIRTPVIRSIYGAFKQIFETVLNRSSKSFRQAVLFEYPRPGSWAMGFLTGRTSGFAGDGDSLHVFVPTTPNPTSGFLLLLPEDQVSILSMSVEDGIKMVVSGGLVTPKPVARRVPGPPTLNASASEARREPISRTPT